jgi:AGCS family alanine or glycine:cation symporter
VQVLETVVEVANELVWATPTQLPWLVALLLGTGFYVTVRLGFIQLRHVRHAFRVVAGKYDDPNDEGDISHFAALSTALSATVGIGNIAGVATAIHYGGPGAMFWMWLTALFGMALKYAECTLSMQYRVFDDNGDAAGGPMYYIEKGLGSKWKPLAILFAFCGVVASFGGGNMNQANSVAVSAVTEFSWDPYVVGVVLAVMVGATVLGGIRRIASVSSKLAPSMAALYVLAALVILVLNAGEIPGAFFTIVTDAFNPKASLGGSVAGTFAVTLLWGVKRGLFSNEAGQGSAPIAHAAAKTDEPVREGAVAMLGPLIDTLIICTMTGLVITITGVWDQKTDGLGLVEHSTAIPAQLLNADSPTESVRVGEALAAVEAGVSKQSFEVRDGEVTGLAFVFNDALVDGAKLYDDDQKLFTGTVEFDGLGHVTPGNLWLRGDRLYNSSALTALAFDRGLKPIGNFGSLIVTLCVFLFAVSTMISWSYYGDRCVTYLWGSKFVLPYRVIFTLFVFLGSILALEVVWAYGDLALGLMSVPNLIAVVLLLPKLLGATKDYFDRMKVEDAKS